MDLELSFSDLFLNGIFAFIAYVLRLLHKDVQEVKIELAKIVTQSESKDEKIRSLEKTSDDFRKRFHALNNNVQELRQDILVIKQKIE